jgi:hypothetical protein
MPRRISRPRASTSMVSVTCSAPSRPMTISLWNRLMRSVSACA